ncbi:DNA polymerase III subunit delta [Salinisphaera sp. Q1T1-3]|uniref:DNA polymerase III subunit delta n=1 Tax=Salinisphaera sp. Q1T1-3 TaxID=2321229 RepID=UPI000E7149D9|nr:DNA polymerase III subunit delta [Salinisphaera sp. Q1T1-3]RJS93533.1 DNA polymerase III subunit delta [Salinisphaera sp. Q1T1-3]
MDIRADDFEREFARHPLARCYLVAGAEPLHVVEAADAIRRRARDEGFDERDILHAEPGFDWSQLAEAGATQSLFAERRIVELHLPDKGPGGKAGSAAISDFVARDTPDTLLLIVAPGLAASARKSAWYKAVAKAGVVSFAWPMPASRMAAWIGARAKTRDLRLQDDAIQLLATQNEGNLLAAAQEIDRLALLYPDTTVDRAAAAEAAADHARFDIFDLPAKALDGDTAGALKSLSRLRAEGVDAVPITWALVNDLRTLYQAALAARANRLDAFFGKIFLPAPKKRQLTRVARQADPAHLARLLVQAARLDAINKGAASGRAWDELLTLTIALSGKQPTAATSADPLTDRSSP